MQLGVFPDHADICEVLTSDFLCSREIMYELEEVGETILESFECLCDFVCFS